MTNFEFYVFIGFICLIPIAPVVLLFRQLFGRVKRLEERADMHVDRLLEMEKKIPKPKTRHPKGEQ